MAFTRRTHIVRVTDPNNKQRYVDVEVLDAVAFRGAGGKIMVLNTPAKNARPYVRDDTGDGDTLAPGLPTRASHMERITNPDDSSQFIDVEVLDYLAFTTPNGEKWVLDMPSKSSHPYIVDDTGEGDSGVEGGGDPTRRMTVNKVKNPANDGQFISVARPDSISFHKANGEKMIIYAPDKSAVPHTTPDNYTPDNKDSVPPENTDPNPYIRWPKSGDGGPWLGKARVKQGPLWWIRAAKSGTGVGVLKFNVSWSSTRSGYGDNPTLEALKILLSGAPFSVPPQALLTLLKYPITDPQIIFSAPPYIVNNDVTSTETVHLASQETLFFQPEHSAGFPFGGVFTNSSVDGLAITGGPYGSTGQAATVYFETQIDTGHGSGLGPGTVFSWGDLQGFGIIPMDVPDPDRIETTESVTIHTQTYTAAVLAFIDLGMATAAEAPGANQFSFDIHTGPSVTQASYSWNATFETYGPEHAKADFTFTNHNVPTWGFAPISAATLNSGAGGEGHSFPANVSTFTVHTAAGANTVTAHKT